MVKNGCIKNNQHTFMDVCCVETKKKNWSEFDSIQKLVHVCGLIFHHVCIFFDRISINNI